MQGQPPDLPSAPGVTFSRVRDVERLGSQLSAVWRALQGGRRWTLADLSAHVSRELGRPCSDASVSARLRCLKRVDHGGHDVRCERVAGGTFQYWLEMPVRRAEQMALGLG